jgi:hypothetical protein
MPAHILPFIVYHFPNHLSSNNLHGANFAPPLIGGYLELHIEREEQLGLNMILLGQHHNMNTF